MTLLHFLASQGINVYSWHGQSVKDYDWCIDQVLKHKPTILTDDGADMNIKAHFDKRFKDMEIFGATEETTAGVTRIRAVENQGKLRYPVILVNEAYTKHMFDNRYGTGQSTIDGYLRAMNLLMASKRVVVVGYGWVGRGVASRCNGMGSKVIVTEVDPVKALEAHMDGFEVMPMNEAAKIGDMFITCTGMTSVIRKEHILKMKDGAIMGNVGHFDVEIDSKFLLKSSKSVKEVRPSLDECTLKNGKTSLSNWTRSSCKFGCSRRSSSRSNGPIIFKSNSYLYCTFLKITKKWKTKSSMFLKKLINKLQLMP